MDEKIKAAVDKYPVDVCDSYRTRNGFVCVTDQGLRIIKEYPYGENHLIYENLLKNAICAHGYEAIDTLLNTKEGGLWAEDGTGRHFVMKIWYGGRECDARDHIQILNAAKNLGRLHHAMKNLQVECEWCNHYEPQVLSDVFQRRTRELRKIINYVQAKRQKTRFELRYMTYYQQFYEQAIKAQSLCEKSACDEMLMKAISDGTFIHGDYSHHHVLLGHHQLATVNFDKAVPGMQVQDLYYFMRKILEKNHWDSQLGKKIIKAYECETPLSISEKEYLFILLLYPEKFWKLANHYYNSKKSWTSVQNYNKLNDCINGMEEKEKCLFELCMF